jgi:hypothetical protein
MRSSIIEARGIEYKSAAISTLSVRSLTISSYLSQQISAVPVALLSETKQERSIQIERAVLMVVATRFELVTKSTVSPLLYHLFLRRSSIVAHAGVLPVFHGLNLSTQQIAVDLNLHPDNAHTMAAHLCEGIEIDHPAQPNYSRALGRGFESHHPL